MKRYTFDVIAFGGMIVVDDKDIVTECHKNFSPLIGQNISEIKKAIIKRKHRLQLTEVQDLTEYIKEEEPS